MRIAFVQDVNTFSVPIGTAIIAGVLRGRSVAGDRKLS